MSQPSPDSSFIYTIHSDLTSDQLMGYCALQQQLDQAARAFEGYLGQEVVEENTLGDGVIRSTVRIKFASLETCLAWLDSSVRRALLHQAEAQLGYGYRSALEGQSFDQWISTRLPQKTPIWKINLIVWLALYPSVMALIWIGQSTLGRLPLPLNMLISNAMTVALTGWLLVPWLTRVYSDWLVTRSRRWNVIYSLTVIAWLMLALWVFSTMPGTPWSDLAGGT